MHNGKSFTTSFKESTTLELKSSSQSCPSEISRLNGLQIEAFSVLEEYLKKISTVLRKPLEPPYKPQSIMLPPMSWELVVVFRRGKSVPRDTIFSKNARTYIIHDSDQIRNNHFTWWSWTVYQRGWTLTERRNNDCASLFQNKQSRCRRRSHWDGTFQKTQIAFGQDLRKRAASDEHVR